MKKPLLRNFGHRILICFGLILSFIALAELVCTVPIPLINLVAGISLAIAGIWGLSPKHARPDKRKMVRDYWAKAELESIIRERKKHRLDQN